MNTLRKALDLQRSTDPNVETGHLCYTTKPQSSALRVQTADKTQWVLPWMHFVHGRQCPSKDREMLTLTFVSHEVRLLGRNFDLLAEELANLNLDKVNALPEEYREAITDEPFIESIQVRAVNDLIEQPIPDIHTAVGG